MVPIGPVPISRSRTVELRSGFESRISIGPAGSRINCESRLGCRDGSPQLGRASHTHDSNPFDCQVSQVLRLQDQYHIKALRSCFTFPNCAISSPPRCHHKLLLLLEDLLLPRAEESAGSVQMRRERVHGDKQSLVREHIVH
jgi:hypothetical protein